METRIQSYLRGAASFNREVEQIGPFLATFTLHTDNPYVNYAIPEDGAQPSSAEVEALATAFGRHGRRPRLEYISMLAPHVEAALVACGFAAEGRTPLMVCPPGTARSVPVPPGIEILTPVTDDDLLAMSAALSEAFRVPPPDSEDVKRLRASTEAGMIAVMARDRVTGEAAGGGMCTVPQAQTTEVAGIGVRPPFRRRGVAASLTARLLDAAFGAGVTLPFLMAAGEVEARIYARAGFTEIGKVLHISRPDAC